MVTEEDRQLLTQRAALQTAAVIGHISHEQAKIWLVRLAAPVLSLHLLFLLLLSSSSSMSYSLSH